MTATPAPTKLRRGLKVSRALQLFGAMLAVAGIASCVDGGSRGVAWFMIAAITLILGARIYEWLTKE